MIQQVQFPFQQQVNGKSPLIAIIFTALILLVLFTLLMKFVDKEDNKKTKWLSAT